MARRMNWDIRELEIKLDGHQVWPQLTPESGLDTQPQNRAERRAMERRRRRERQRQRRRRVP